MRNYVIVNPMSSGGATASNWPTLKIKLEAAIGAFDFALTEHAKHATALTRDALRHGYDRIIAVGGDGTINEVVNGFFEKDKPVSDNATLGVIDAGTGGDFVKNIGLLSSQDDQIAVLSQGKSKVVTLGSAVVCNETGAQHRYYFTTICSFGISGEINHAVNSAPRLKRYLTSTAFTLVALKKILTYRDQPISIAVDGKMLVNEPLLLGAVCNGIWTGGGMMMAPNADSFAPDLDIIFATKMSFIETLMAFTSLFKGTHIHQPKITALKGTEIHIAPLSDEKMMIDMDGDFVGYLPAKVQSHPAAIKVCC